MSPKRKAPLKDSTVSKTNKKVKYIERPYNVKNINLTLNDEVSIQCYIHVTVSNISEFKDEKINETERELKAIGFTYDPEKSEFDSYHEGNVMFMTGFYILKSKFNIIQLLDQLWDIYEDNHVDLYDIKFTIETSHRFLFFDWYVFRFNSNTNNGIMRDMDQVLKYEYYNDKSFDKHMKKNKIKLITLNNKDRPFRGIIKVFNKFDIQSIIKFTNSHTSCINASSTQEHYNDYIGICKKNATKKIQRTWRLYINRKKSLIC